jgi:hypothetical protein
MVFDILNSNNHIELETHSISETLNNTMSDQKDDDYLPDLVDIEPTYIIIPPLIDIPSNFYNLQEISTETIAQSLAIVNHESLVVSNSMFIAMQLHTECSEGTDNNMAFDRINQFSKEARHASNVAQKSYNKCLQAFIKATKSKQIHLTHVYITDKNTRTYQILKQDCYNKLLSDNNQYTRMKFKIASDNVNRNATINYDINLTLDTSDRYIRFMDDILYDIDQYPIKAAKFADRTKSLADKYYNKL